MQTVFAAASSSAVLDLVDDVINTSEYAAEHQYLSSLVSVEYTVGDAHHKNINHPTPATTVETEKIHLMDQEHSTPAANDSRSILAQQPQQTVRTTTNHSGSFFVQFLSYLFAAATGVAACFVCSLAMMGAEYLHAIKQGGTTVVTYWRTLLHYWSGGSYADCPHFADSVDARVHLRSLALINEIWHSPHYRNDTFGVDMAKNLRNVAVPGTGIPLSVLCFSSTVFKLVLLVVYPLVALASAIIRRKPEASAVDVCQSFIDHLVRPTDWFSLWRLNCRLASYHALTTKDAGYRMEDKWTFIKESLDNGTPVSPIMDIPSIVCKDRNEEGGMGIHFFKNVVEGGDWIIQKALKNSSFLSTLLPEKAPLSTIRIVTGSTKSFAASTDTKPIKALSCVFRAGRAGAATDHDAILFDVDLKSGLIKQGSINKEWYKLGVEHLNPYNRPDVSVFTEHPDCGKKVTGVTIPNIEALEAICTNAHLDNCPNVPLCGWDVALTTDGIFLLEVNLSCNFFQATVDYKSYFEFVDQHFKHLESVGASPAAEAEASLETVAPAPVETAPTPVKVTSTPVPVKVASSPTRAPEAGCLSTQPAPAPARVKVVLNGSYSIASMSSQSLQNL
jgi:hypothetical protein